MLLLDLSTFTEATPSSIFIPTCLLSFDQHLPNSVILICFSSSLP